MMKDTVNNFKSNRGNKVDDSNTHKIYDKLSRFC